MNEMRARFRAQVREEVKGAALRQLAEGGPAAVSLNAIARELGVSGPGLYRYVAGRDALLAELAADAFADATAAVTGSTDLRSFAQAFRAWALAQPHRYRLLFVAPSATPAHREDDVVTRSHELMRALVAALDGPHPRPAPALRRQLEVWAAEREGTLEPGAALHGIAVWAALHGFVALEVEGNFASMGLDPDLLFEAQLAALGA
jgi:AcrR family transcriptional regulator